MTNLTPEQREALTEVLRDSLDEWMFRMHGITSSCDHAAEADGTLDALAPTIARLLAEAWSLGHAAGRDYQADGWNSDAHDPEDDNPYRATPATPAQRGKVEP